MTILQLAREEVERGKFIKILFLVILDCFIASGLLRAQEDIPNGSPSATYDPILITSRIDAMLTQHWAMPTLLNPAATGDIDFIRIRGGARLEMLGKYHAPKSFLATADSPFKLGGKRIGAGVIVNSENYDLYRNLLISAQGSYKFQFKNNSRLSIGIQLGYYHSKFRGSEFVIDNSGNHPEEEPGEEDDKEESDEGQNNFNNEDMPTQDVKGGVLDLAIGIRYESPKFYVGISGQHLTNSRVKLTTDGESSTDSRYIESKLPISLYFDTGGNIPISNSLFTLQPSLILGTDFSDFTGVAELRTTYNNLLTFGVDYRYNSAVGVLAGINLKNFFLGYNWEYDYTTPGKGTTGNHEIIIGYQFKMDMGGKNLFRHRSIRIM